jgi:DNA repair protein RecO (recombination protein O)
MITKVEGIVIRSTDYGEGNKILTIYSQELGKIGVMAKGAKKTKSRLSAVSQLFIQGYFVLYHGSGLGTLTHGELIKSYRGIHLDIIKTAWSAYIVELVDKLCEEREPNPVLFRLLETALTMIEMEKDPEIVTRVFEMQLLQMVGIRPEVRWCAHCNRTDFPLLAFSLREGGLICQGCLPKDPEASILSPGSIRLLRIFATMDLNKLGKVEVKEETRKQIRQVMKSFIDLYAGIQLKSRNFLEQISQFTAKATNEPTDKGEYTHGEDP